jgi:hypothetical protein
MRAHVSAVAAHAGGGGNEPPGSTVSRATWAGRGLSEAGAGR